MRGQWHYHAFAHCGLRHVAGDSGSMTEIEARAVNWSDLAVTSCQPERDTVTCDVEGSTGCGRHMPRR